MRVLVIDDLAKERAAKVVAYAQQRDHWYVLDTDNKSKQPPPGTNYRHVTTVNTYRCVFSYTFDERVGMVFRHLSISIPSVRFASPIAAYAIAELFGFTGWSMDKAEIPGQDWLMSVNPHEHCVMLQQAIEPQP
jgi:hypothetical protein